MKYKPISHKDKNLFKYQSFPQQIQLIRINAKHRINKYDLEDKDKETIFSEKLRVLRDLNCTEDFEDLFKKLGHDLQTLDQVIFKKDYIADELKKSLTKENNNALNATLELIIAFAKDLREIFYEEYFLDFFNLIRNLLVKSTNPTEIEQLFQCLATIFVVLEQFFTKDIKNMYSSFCELLSDSHKPYIRTFAAESFGYIIRKVVSKKEKKSDSQGELFNHMFQDAEQLKNLYQGIGSLLIESIKSTKGIYHSCVECIFPLILDCLGLGLNPNRHKLPFQEVELCALELINLMNKYSSNCEVPFKIICDTIEMLLLNLKQDCPNEEFAIEHLQRVLRVFTPWLEYNNGINIVEPELLAPVISHLLTIPLDNITWELILKIASTFLLSKTFDVSPFHDVILETLFKSQVPLVLILEFCKSMFAKEDQFIQHIFPKVLQKFEAMLHENKAADDFLEESIVEFLIQMIVKYKSEFTEFSSVPLKPNFYFNDKDNLNSEIVKLNLGQLSLDSELRVWSGLLCLPFISIFNKEEVRQRLTALSNKLKNERQDWNFALHQLLLTYFSLGWQNCIAEDFDLVYFVDKLNQNSSSILYLKNLRIFIEANPSLKTDALLSELLPALKPNLASPFSKVRLNSLQILVQFPLVIPSNNLDLDYSENNILKICLKAEQHETTLFAYREKGKYLEKLKYEMAMKLVPSEDFLELGLLFILGTQHINFNPLWKDLPELIATYARKLGEKFWTIYIGYLQNENLHTQVQKNEESSRAINFTGSLGDIVCKQFKKSVQCFERVDPFTYRDNLWKAILRFPPKDQIKKGSLEMFKNQSKGLIPLVLNLVKNELEPLEAILARTQNIHISSAPKEDLEKAHKPKKVTRDADKESKRKSMNSLKEMLIVFSKFKTPPGKDSEMKQLYLQLLTSHDTTIQKHAFQCLLTYKEKFLNPYRDNFELIIQDESFKDQILFFNLDPDNSQILDKHRPGVINVLMRILFGKMHKKVGKKGDNNRLRFRGTVIRFLSSCDAKELKVFMDFAFQPLNNIVEEDIFTSVNQLESSLDLKAVIPLNRLHSCLQTLEILFKELGNLLTDSLPLLLKYLIYIGAYSVFLIDRKEEISSYSVNLIKSIRGIVYDILLQFFETFDSYEFSPSEENSLFKVFIEPKIAGIPHESLNEPSPFLKLILKFSQQKRFHYLFEKNIMDNLMLLYTSSNIKASVINFLNSIIHNILTVDDDEELPKESESIEIIKPHIIVILKRMQSMFDNAKDKKHKKTLSKDELEILIRISGYANDSFVCSNLTRLLCNYLNKIKLDPEEKNNLKASNLQVSLLQIINKLASNIDNPRPLLDIFAPLFFKITTPLPRTLLCEVLQTMTTRDSSLQQISDIISQINAYHHERREEPDFESQENGCEKALKFVESNTNAKVESLLIVHSTLFHLKNKNINLTLLNFFKCFFSCLKVTDYSHQCQVIKIALLQIKNGLPNENPHIRTNSVQLLIDLLNAFPDDTNHNVLKELSQLNYIMDERSSFWQQLINKKVINQERAISKLEELMSKGDVLLSPPQISGFIIPIATMYLASSEDSGSSLTVKALELLGTCGFFLPWEYYKNLLLKHINIMQQEVNKTNVKAVSIILDKLNLEKFTLSIDTTIMVVDEEIEDEDENEKVQFKLMPNIHNDIIKNIIPSLHKSLTSTGVESGTHKYAGMDHSEAHKKKMIKIPFALPIVKLLQKLGPTVLEKNLPGIILHMSNLLKDKEDEIRKSARDVLISCCKCLGSRYLFFIFNELRGMLKRGYQVHVLAYTYEAILSNMKDQLEPGDLNDSLNLILEVCKEELFSDVAEEKEAEKFISKFKEAKATKSYSIYETIGKFITANKIHSYLQPLKDVLAVNHSSTTITRAHECFKKAVIGITSNSSVVPKDIFQIAFNILNNLLPNILSDKVTKPKTESKKSVRKDIYLLEKAPSRTMVPKVDRKTNLYYEVEFGLKLVYSVLKKKENSNVIQEFEELKTFKELLDPFVKSWLDCLMCKHPQLVTTSLQTIYFAINYDLPSMDALIQDVFKSIITLICRYSGMATQGQTLQMVSILYKTLEIVLSRYNVDSQHLQVLLSYVDQNLSVENHPVPSYKLIEPLLKNKVENSDQLKVVMKLVADLSIRSEQENVRKDCRQACLYYMQNYLKGAQLRKFMQHFMVQLEKYEVDAGRSSAAEMIYSVIEKLNKTRLQENGFEISIPLGLIRVIIAAGPEILIDMVEKTLIKYLKKVDPESREKLFNHTFKLFESVDDYDRYTFLLLVNILAKSEGREFESRLPNLMPILAKQLVPNSNEDEEKNDEEPSKEDIYLYSLLEFLTTIIQNCEIARSTVYRTHLNVIWGKSFIVTLFLFLRNLK